MYCCHCNKLYAVPVHLLQSKSNHSPHCLYCSRMVLTNKPLFVLFNVISFIGLVWQMYQVSLGYFKYEVITTLSFNLSASNEERVTNVRFLYYEVFDRARYEKDKSIKLSIDNNSFDAFLSASYFTESVSIDDVIKYTPNGDSIILYCDHRTLASYLDCDPESNVKIEKFVVNLFVIYRFKFISKKLSKHDESTVFYNPNNYGSISMLSIKPDYFNHANVIGFFLNSDGIPFIENSLAKNTDTDYDYTTRRQRQLGFGLRPHAIKVHKLPPPYITNCKENYNFYDCYAICVNDQSVKKLNRLAPLKYHTKSNLKQLTYYDVLNSSKHSIYESIISQCQIECPDRECIKEIVVTSVERSAIEPLTFYQTLSDNPSFIVFSSQKDDLADYLTLVMSCFGTWFGWSVISLNPFRFKDKHVNLVNNVKFIELVSIVSRERFHNMVLSKRVKKMERIMQNNRMR